MPHTSAQGDSSWEEGLVLLPVFSEQICICTLISSSIRTNALTSELGLCLELDNQPAILADVDPDYLQPG